MGWMLRKVRTGRLRSFVVGIEVFVSLLSLKFGFSEFFG